MKVVIGSNAQIGEIDLSSCRRGRLYRQHINVEFIESSCNEVPVCIVEKCKNLKGGLVVLKGVVHTEGVCGRI